MTRRRRESIDDHLTSARRALAPYCTVPIDGSRELVRDLVRNKLIAHTYEVHKRAGRGRGRRFKPADYRDLMEILRLRADGHVHRRRWLIWLWLRGRSFPLDRVRDALTAEIAAHTKTILAQLHPTGRLTEDLLTKYRRNIGGKKSQTRFPDIGNLDEVMAMLMLRPHDAANVPVDTEAFVRLASETLGIDEAVMRKGFNDFGPASGKDMATATAAFAQLMPDRATRAVFAGLAQAGPSALSGIDALAGLIDDGTGRSALLPALTAATDAQLLAARREVRFVRTGILEDAFRKTVGELEHADEIALLAFAADWARTQRHLHRGNPAYAAYLSCIQVKANGEPIPLPPRRTIDVNALLRRLRDG